VVKNWAVDDRKPRCLSQVEKLLRKWRGLTVNSHDDAMELCELAEGREDIFLVEVLRVAVGNSLSRLECLTLARLIRLATGRGVEPLPRSLLSLKQAYLAIKEGRAKIDMEGFVVCYQRLRPKQMFVNRQGEAEERVGMRRGMRERNGRPLNEDSGLPMKAEGQSLRVLESESAGAIGKSTLKRAGDGLYLVRAVRKGERIAKYRGEVMSLAEGDRRSMSSNSVLACGGIAIDGASGGNFSARYINDALNHRLDNCEMVCDSDGGISIVALMDMECDRECFMAYGWEYWWFSKNRELREGLCARR